MYEKYFKLPNEQLLKLLNISQHWIKVNDPTAISKHHAIRSRVAKLRKDCKDLFNCRILKEDLDFLRQYEVHK